MHKAIVTFTAALAVASCTDSSSVRQDDENVTEPMNAGDSNMSDAGATSALDASSAPNDAATDPAPERDAHDAATDPSESLECDASAHIAVDAGEHDSSHASEDAAADGGVQFLDVRVESITSTRAVVRFDTSQPTSCEAMFGTAPDALDRSATDPDMEEGQLVRDHNVPLEDLMPSQTYYWRAKATNAAGETYVSALYEFQTTEAQEHVPEGTNVALLEAGTTVSGVSSNFGGGSNDGSWGADNAIDGMMATEWSSSGDGDDAWLTLDLGQTRTIHLFGFRSRQMTDGSAIVRSVQLIFDDDTVLGPYLTPDPEQLYQFALEPPMTARGVRVEAVTTTGGNTGAKEIQLFGE